MGSRHCRRSRRSFSSVKELPVGDAAYRSIVIDIPGSYIAGGLEPKNKVAVNEGLVGQVRVKQWGGTVRVYVDVIAFPKYKVAASGGQVVVGIDTAQAHAWARMLSHQSLSYLGISRKEPRKGLFSLCARHGAAATGLVHQCHLVEDV